MAEVRIEVPGSLTAEAAIAFGWQLEDVSVADQYIVDLRLLRHVEPFGMLVCASILRRFVRSRKELGAKFAAVGFADNSYAAHMGLYQAFGLPYGKKPGEASGSTRYIPITCLSTQDLHRAAGYAPVGEAIEREAQRLANVLLQRTDGSRLSHISYALLEMMRNVVEHSSASEIWYAAQCWPNRKCVEIAILDEGIGVRRSLSRNPIHQPSSDEEALLLALQAGVSGVPVKSEEMTFRDAYSDGWENAGLGLFVVSKLCAEGGTFSIASGTACRHLTNTVGVTALAKFPGTAIRMKLNTFADDDINKFIYRILPADFGRNRSRVPRPGA
jgi:hypothetical protein